MIDAIKKINFYSWLPCKSSNILNAAIISNLKVIAFISTLGPADHPRSSSLKMEPGRPTTRWNSFVA